MNKYIWEGYNKENKRVCDGEVLACNIREANELIQKHFVENPKEYEGLEFYHYNITDMVLMENDDNKWMIECSFIPYLPNEKPDERNRREDKFYFSDKEKLNDFINGKVGFYTNVVVKSIYKLERVDKKDII